MPKATTPAARRWSSGRDWHPPARTPLPSVEAGRARLNALLNGPGGPRFELKTTWDDRAETSIKAVYRYLWRLAHANKSGAFACSVDQLVSGLMPVMGWQDHGDARANRSAHSRSVRRWLERLAAMGLIEWAGVRDAQNRWWRTEITLLEAPAPDPYWLRAAQVRLRAFERRERRRRRCRPRRRRDLGRVLARSQAPGARARRASALRRALRRHNARRGSGCAPAKVSSNPLGAPATQEQPHHLTTTANQPEFANGEGAHARKTDDHSAPPHPSMGSADVANGKECIEERPAVSELREAQLLPDRIDAELSRERLLARVAAREAAIRGGLQPPTKFHVMQATQQRAYEALLQWPSGRPIPARVLSDAFEHATGRPARMWRDGRHKAALARAIERYERHAEQRPACWPASGAGALALAMTACAQDSRSIDDRGYHREALSLTWAIGRLNVVSKQMAAAAKRANPARELDQRRRRTAATRASRSARANRVPACPPPRPHAGQPRAPAPPGDRTAAARRHTRDRAAARLPRARPRPARRR